VRILLTTTSFQDTPGPHHDLLAATGWEIVRARGPLTEADTLSLVGDIDGYICGDDAITRRVLIKSQPRLKVLSKYGIGIDKVDVAAATELGIPFLFTPGVNHTTVAEHTFLLLLSLEKNLLFHTDSTRGGGWKRKTGHELFNKTLSIVGFGRVGREVAVRARAFGMNVVGLGRSWDDVFAHEHQIKRAASLPELCGISDYITLHISLNEETRGLINARSIAGMKKGVIIVNCARGDVLDQEPPPADHPLLHLPNVVVTPHIGSRTYESVARQAMMAAQNLIQALNGEKPHAQINPEVPIRKAT